MRSKIRMSILAVLTIIGLIAFSSITRTTADTFADGFTEQAYESNIIDRSGDTLVISALSNSYAFLEKSVAAGNALSFIETRLQFLNGSSGAAWGPGIGILIDDINFIQMNIQQSEGGDNNQRVGLTGGFEGNYGGSYKTLDINYNVWVTLKLTFTGDGFVIPIYSFDNGTTWVNYFDSGYTTVSAFPYNLQNAAFDLSSSFSMMVGKGYASAVTIPSDPSFSGFKTSYTENTGTIGSVEFAYIDVGYVLDTVTQIKTETLLQNITKTESATINGFTYPVGISGLGIMILTRFVIKAKSF